MIVFPPAYAACNEIALLSHLVTIPVVSFTHINVPLAADNPVMIRLESASVLKVTSLASLGLKVAVEFAVSAPVTVKSIINSGSSGTSPDRQGGCRPGKAQIGGIGIQQY